jgi:hypothetical protein
MEKQFPNGFYSWAETHHEIVSIVALAMQDPIEMPMSLEEIQMEQGSTGITELCIRLTDEFEELNRGREWDGEWIDEVYEFTRKNLGV